MNLEWEIEELACLACGKSEEETDNIINSACVDDMLYEKYEVSFDQYFAIVKDLIKFTSITETALLKTKCQGFINGNEFIVKQEIK